MHEGSKRGQRHPGQVADTAALHVEDDDVSLRQQILGQLDVVEHAEDTHGVCEVQLAVVEL